MSFSVQIRQWETPIVVEMGQTVLEAAIAQGVPYPHGCRSGNCGACKSRLLSGEIDLGAHSEFALTVDERERGLVLACRTTPWSDCEIAWLDAEDVIVHPSRILDCEVTAIERATHDITVVRLTVQNGGPFTFSAGQFASVTFAGQAARDYSMANRPDQAELEFHIRVVDGGSVSAFVAETLALGDKVRVEGPHGAAYLRETHKGPILAVAGGSGLAPIKSIVETALSAGMSQPIALYFGVRDVRDLYLVAHFEDLARKHGNFHFIPVLSEAGAEGEFRTGFVHDAVLADSQDFDGRKVYTAGPPVMVEALSAVVCDHGLRAEDLHADAFYTAAEQAALNEQGGKSR